MKITAIKRKCLEESYYIMFNFHNKRIVDGKDMITRSNIIHGATYLTKDEAYEICKRINAGNKK